MTIKKCNECGCNTEIIKRKYKDKKYCRTCYLKLFKKSPCSVCKLIYRLPVFEIKPICNNCLVKTPCIRCKKAINNIGKITKYGAVCKICSIYFNNSKPCEYCSRQSKQLLKKIIKGITYKCCQNCYQRDCKTCIKCHRYRKVYSIIDNKPVCKLCYTTQDIQCNKCKKNMPAGRVTICSECYWNNNLNNKIKINMAFFKNENIAIYFRKFSKWLNSTRGSHYTATNINRYFKFFEEIDEYWNFFPKYNSLINHFGSEGIRKFRLINNWILDDKIEAIDINYKNESSERKMILKKLSYIKTKEYKRLAFLFIKKLLTNKKNHNSKYRSIRLILTPSINLIITSENINTFPPNQKCLNKVLKKSPGQRNSLSSFTTFINNKYSNHPKLILKNTSPKDKLKKRRRNIESKLLEFLHTDNNDINLWIELSLQYFHDVPLSWLNNKKYNYNLQDDWIIVHLNYKEYSLPNFNYDITLF